MKSLRLSFPFIYALFRVSVTLVYIRTCVCTHRKKRAKVLLFFELTKFFYKKMHFFRVFLHFFKKKAHYVANPWYTGDFESTYHDLVDGCKKLL